MPRYDYRCTVCGDVREHRRPFAFSRVCSPCESCGGATERLFSRFSAPRRRSGPTPQEEQLAAAPAGGAAAIGIRNCRNGTISNLHIEDCDWGLENLGGVTDVKITNARMHNMRYGGIKTSDGAIGIDGLDVD